MSCLVEYASECGKKLGFSRICDGDRDNNYVDLMKEYLICYIVN